MWKGKLIKTNQKVISFFLSTNFTFLTNKTTVIEYLDLTVLLESLDLTTLLVRVFKLTKQYIKFQKGFWSKLQKPVSWPHDYI